MEKEPSPDELSRIEEATNIILGARDAVEAQFQRSTRNSWAVCFTEIMFQLRLELGGPAAGKEIGTDVFQRIGERMKTLQIRLDELKKAYPDRDSSPLPEEKEQMFNMLEEIKGEFAS